MDMLIKKITISEYQFDTADIKLQLVLINN